MNNSDLQLNNEPQQALNKASVSGSYIVWYTDAKGNSQVISNKSLTGIKKMIKVIGLAFAYIQYPNGVTGGEYYHPRYNCR